jgi:hypothetical protein
MSNYIYLFMYNITFILSICYVQYININFFTISPCYLCYDIIFFKWSEDFLFTKISCSANHFDSKRYRYFMYHRISCIEEEVKRLVTFSKICPIVSIIILPDACIYITHNYAIYGKGHRISLQIKSPIAF